MRLTLRLILSFVLVALFAAGISAVLGSRAVQGNVQRFLQDQGLIERPETTRDREDRRPPQYTGAPNRSFRGPPPERDRLALIRRLQASQAQTALLALGAALAVGGLLAFRLVRPIRSLSEIHRRYAAGERAARADVRGGDEIAQLAASFNQMADQLNAREERERRMVADIAHELRTPLTVLKGDLESLQDGLLESKPEVFGRLVEEVDLLERLVQDLRLISLVEAGQLSLNLRDVALGELVGGVLTSFQTKADTKGIVLEPRLQSIQLRADPERVKQILYNLLENALRHTPDGGRIVVSLSRQDTWAVLEVTDSGPGIAPEHLSHLFDRFYRADEARARESGGSGLGLAIVKGLVQAHRGRVTAGNAPGGGAAFTVRLPLSTDAASG
ncbi:MAG: ATP-binding protein [Meiothermus sp.]|nr:ATP-binding protein [Meiothermus sp.]